MFLGINFANVTLVAVITILGNSERSAVMVTVFWQLTGLFVIISSIKLGFLTLL